jgi:hypothetical protein
MQVKLLGISSVNFDVTSQRLIRCSINNSTTDQMLYIRQILEKTGNIMVQYMSYLQISRKPMIQLGRKYCKIFSLSLEYPGS